MTLAELGSHARHLTDAVVSRDWLAVLKEVSNAQSAIAEFVAGWSDPRPHMALSPEQLGAVDAAVSDCVDACRLARAEVTPQAGQPRPVGAAINPATILAIIQIAQAVAELIRKLREDRQPTA